MCRKGQSEREKLETRANSHLRVCRIAQTFVTMGSSMRSRERGDATTTQRCGAISPVQVVAFVASERFHFMKTDVSPQTEPRTHIEGLLDALRIQEEILQDLAVKARDHLEPEVLPEDRRPAMSRP